MGVEEVLAEAKSRVEELLAPINGGVGEDVSYNEKFEALKTESDKQSSLTGETVNWANIESFSNELLAEKAKDFRVACYYAAAKARTGKVQDFLDGLVVLHELQKAFWDTMNPPTKRMRARSGIFQWFVEASGAPLMEMKLSVKDYDVVQALDQLSRELDAQLREKMADAYPGFGKIRDGVKNLVSTCPKPAPPAPPPSETPTAEVQTVATEAQVYVPETTDYSAYGYGGGGGGGEVVNVGMVTDPDNAFEALLKSRTLVLHIASVIRAAKLENPVPYRLARACLWVDLHDAPAVVDGNTMVAPPNWELAGRFDALATAEDWLTLLQESEACLGECPLWLDPHRWSALAMDSMGFAFAKAKKALVFEMAILLARFPNLPNLTFNTGEPYANPQTKLWLESEVSSVLRAGGKGGGAGASSIDEPMAQAKSLVVQGKLSEGVGVVGRALFTAPSEAERFRGKLALAQLCLRAGKFEVARAQLDGLHRQIEKRDLMSWEPALCGEVYAALSAVYQTLYANGAPSPEAAAAQQVAFERLCQLDPAGALTLMGEPAPPS